MSGFPDPEDEFELMYGDDMDIAFELEENFPPVASPLKKSKRSLDFREVNAALPPHTQLSSPKPLEASPIVRSTTKNKGNSPRVKSPKGKSKPVALQSKELFSWQVIELKSPTDESPEGKSPKDKSLKGKSPKDKSLKGKSPKGKSPKDKSPEGKSKPVPLQSKELFRWQVIDLKSPTDESSEGKPPKGKSPKGKSPEGKSPKDKSPKGKSPKDKSPKGKSPEGKSKPKALQSKELFSWQVIDLKSRTDESPEAKSPKDKSPKGKSPKDKSPKGKSPEGKSKPKALQSKELFSWQVIDLKSRTDESPEAKSPKGKSPKGKSPKGKSPTDKSPKVKLPTDKSPKGKSKPVAFQSKQPFSFEVIDLKSSEGKSPKGKSKPAPLKSKQLFSSQVIDLTPNLSSSLQSKVPTSLSHKRTIDETDFDQDFHFPEDLITKKATLFKRPKISLDELKEPVVSPEEQQRTIRKILELRRESQQKVRSGLPRGSVKILSRKENLSGLSRVFPAWPFVKAVDKDGIGVYIKVDSEEDLLEQGSSLSKQYSKGHILSEPFDSLLDAARSINQSKAKLKIKETILQQIRAEKKDTQTGKGELWVEKYRPKNYRQLLSDEGTNRTLLQWLKLWDKAVFDRDLPKHLNKYEEIRVGKGKKTEFKFKRTNVLNQDLDQNDCPVNKVVLLCGPPGLGKTTLAHIVANHAGYNVVELNASDDRSPALFHNTLEAATTMQSVMSENPKPNCLVLDEIDGAPQASIDVLVKYITGKPNTKKKAKGSTGLKRPIICICNDLYVPALRPLRQIAFVLQFPPTSSARLAGRLMEVSKKEKIKTDLSTMMALSEKTGNDIRSCLSALSCYQNQTLRLPAIHNANIGVKDMQKPLFSMWGDIFQIPDDKKVTKPGSNNSTSNNEDHLSKR
ncbi:hypothetical protein M8J75_002296 [Diaphorina citri]|nr:hypothetical protein M8J75_002296 [Diaphorina citri]KAI5753708.1 hypothetical protein M8J77_002646 [Diaphorina citri]